MSSSVLLAFSMDLIISFLIYVYLPWLCFSIFTNEIYDYIAKLYGSVILSE